MSLSMGTRLGPYEITGPLGAGGMGEVYRARDSRLNRDVAIKTLPAAFFDDSNRLGRLQREAQVLASLNHPNIASIYGLEEDRGVRALVMELVEGPTLAERIAKGPIPLDEALGIARQIAEALEAAHEKGIVHRDLKPANIKVTADDKVKVLDFGLARSFDNEATSGNAENSPTLTLESTRAGMIMGTAGYMSPEQARGKAVDKRADIWAFGVVLYEMLAGRFAFEGETVSDTLAAVLRADIDWARLPADVPPKVRRLLQRCLERDVKKRLRDIGDAWADVDAPEEAGPAASARSRWWLYAAAGAVIGAAAGAGYILWRTPAAPPRPVSRWSYIQKDFFNFPALSRDGTRLVFFERTDNKGHLTLRMMDQAEGRPIPGGIGNCPTFSPDGQWIAFLAGSLKKIPVTGGTAMTLAEGAALTPPDWGENGEIVFAALTGGLMKVPAAGGEAQKLTTIDSQKGEKRHLSPQFLPGAKAVVFTIETADSLNVALLDLKKGGYRVLVKDASNARYVPTGHLLFIRGSTLFAAPFDARRLELTGMAVPMVENVRSPNGWSAPYSVSDSGLLVYQNAGSAPGTILAWADRKGAIVPLSTPENWEVGRLSADGKRIAAVIYSASPKLADEGDVWIYETDRGTKTRLTFEGKNMHPIWTPDGQRVTFEGTVAGKNGIYSVPADGSGKPELLLETENIEPRSWSPDGKMLVYRMFNASISGLWVLPMDGGASGKPHRLHETNSSESYGEISPNGKWLAYGSTESGSGEIYVQPFPASGPKVRVSTDGGSGPRWSKDGRELFYIAGAKVMSVEVQMTPQFRAGIPREMFTLTRLASLWDVSPDGKRFLVEQEVPAAEGPHRMEGVVNWFEELRRRVPAGK
jgi:Tol biopolymer transport system component